MKFLLLILAALSAVAADPVKALRVYYIGNSVTDTIRYEPLANLAASRGHRIIWGRHMIPGAPLQWLWDHQTNGFKVDSFGYPRAAFANHDWDVLSLQPFDRQLTSKDSSDDVTIIRRYCELAAKRSSDVQVYLYARWPRITRDGKGVKFDKKDYDPARPGSGASFAGIDDFDRSWLAQYDGRGLSNESRDYFEKLLVAARQSTAFLKKPILLVPVGHAMSALHARMRGGEIAGYTDIHQLYKDGIHLNETGSYLVGCAYYATLFRESPVGLPTEPYGKIDPAIAKAIQETVWQIVRAHPESGVK